MSAAVLALTVDWLLGQVQQGYSERNRPQAWIGALGLSLVALLGFVPHLSRAQSGYVIGAKPFAEQYILAALIEQRLGAKRLAATRRDGLSPAILFNALVAGDVDAYVEYSGTIWANQMQRTDVPPRAEVLSQVPSWLQQQHGVGVVGGLGFENAYALALTQRRADALGITSLADLARHAPTLSIAGDYEFFGRPEWKALSESYNLKFRQQRQMQAEFMYPAAAAGEVDVISALFQRRPHRPVRVAHSRRSKQAIRPMTRSC